MALETVVSSLCGIQDGASAANAFLYA